MAFEMIPKKKYAWDPVTKLARQYQTKIKTAYREIDDHVRTGRSGKISTPNYTKEVILPLARILGEALPELEITVGDKVEVIGSKAYFVICIGGQSIGGLSYPGPHAVQVDFTIFAHEKPWGKEIRITRLRQLVKVIKDIAGFLSLDKSEIGHGEDE